jgi:SAM-dependent methyltransferase
MSGPPLFDDQTYLTRKKRVISTNKNIDFLLNEAHQRIENSLSFIKRPFSKVLYLDGLNANRQLKNSPKATYFDIFQTFDFLQEKGSAATDKYDLVIANFIFHTLNDPVAALKKIQSILKPDGFFIAAFPGGDSLQELRDSLRRAEEEIYQRLSPRTSPMIHIKDAGALLQKAGFALPVADTERITLTYPTLNALCHDLRYMGETNILSASARQPVGKKFWQRAEKIYQEQYGDNNRLPLTVDLITLSGWAPHPDQQKPLSPGDGQQFLGDVL